MPPRRRFGDGFLGDRPWRGGAVARGPELPHLLHRHLRRAAQAPSDGTPVAQELDVAEGLVPLGGARGGRLAARGRRVHAASELPLPPGQGDVGVAACHREAVEGLDLAAPRRGGAELQLGLGGEVPLAAAQREVGALPGQRVAGGVALEDLGLGARRHGPGRGREVPLPGHPGEVAADARERQAEGEVRLDHAGARAMMPGAVALAAEGAPGVEHGLLRGGGTAGHAPWSSSSS
mmetsp:Transcript_107899/g.232385  ORF Transcript_107899/g.232385 Transcript_107899/m.232385 type:complete len:235 (-) Transcript_107899:20-724(-)